MQAKSSDFNRNFSGFGGQYGYYTDAETDLALLTHRCYDPSFGRFVIRTIQAGKKSAKAETLALFFVLFSLPPGPAKRLVRRQP